jgi:putative salt-induced outer membrane protein YdiY
MRKSLRLFCTGISLVVLGALSCTLPANAGEAPAVTPPPPPKWNSSAAAGLTLTSGNSDTMLATANIGTEKKWDKNEVAFGVDGAYGEQDDEKNVETLHGFGQYNRLFTERFFGLFRADALHDAIADVEYRVTLSPGVGYYFIKNKTTFLRGEVGPGVVFEKAGGETDTYMTLRLAERFEHQLSKTARIWQSAEILPDVSDWENYIVNAEIGIDVAINTRWSLRAYLQDTYDNKPADGRKHNDLKLVVGTAYKF